MTLQITKTKRWDFSKKCECILGGSRFRAGLYYIALDISSPTTTFEMESEIDDFMSYT